MVSQHVSFLTFTQQYTRMIHDAIWRVCGDHHPDLQADVEQEVYLALWERWTDGVSIEYPVSYLYKVAVRTALSAVRAQNALAPVDDIEICYDAQQDTSGDRHTTVERTTMLTELLHQLSEDQARAVRAYLAGFTQQEIASLYGWSASVTRHRIYRALQALRTLATQEVIP